MPARASAAVQEGEFQGLPALLITTPLATAAVSLHGGQLLSFVPHGFDDLLWLSPTSRSAPAAIRGGVPVCWPYFGREGQPADVPQHGFARNTRWVLANASGHGDGEDDEDGCTLELELPPHSITPLRLTQRLHIGRQLQQSLSTHNPGATPVTLTQALHSYLRVGDARRVHVEGLHGLAYADRFDGRMHEQSGQWNLHDPRDPGRSDRTYVDAGNRFELVDPVLGRRIELTTAGSRSLVVWNPGESGIAALADVPAQGWRDFVCLEASNAGQDVITVLPGRIHTLQQTLRVHALR